jgi:hypothetical protein
MKVWHYTTDDKLNSIYADEALLPTAIAIGPNERPVLWFSSNPVWEPTANKALGVERNGQRTMIRPMTNAEMFRMFKLRRFGIDSERLMHWPVLRKAARIGMTEQRRMIKRAREMGSAPHHWYGTLDPVPLSDLVREDYIHGEGWVLYDEEKAIMSG